MAKVPLPERGQPIDVAYLYQITNAINQVSDQVSSATYNYTTVDTSSAGKQSIKTSNACIAGGYISVANNTTVTATDKQTFTYSFANQFAYAPIVTTSIINTGRTDAGDNVSVVLTSVTKEGIAGFVKFGSSGDVSAVVNVIAIGIPNQVQS